MPAYRMSDADHTKLLASSRHHFIHGNAAKKIDSGEWEMVFSKNVKIMLEQELGIACVPASDSTLEPKPFGVPS